ncbi:non-ribosomal peptide synthetase [Catenulispora rubra]|uniref:non-ribosomal peptide synthetase n=1 Tax=Catenulispora rubra TaxID=280293 RepID=UPI0018924DB6|nr:amino acid adenylation domain-containing protein [Catenulispora rubra]
MTNGFASISAGRTDPGAFRPVPAMIEDQADRTPERPAVSYDGRTLSYRSLDGLANGLAVALAGRGIGRGAAVPVLLGNSLELPVAYFALMKLGAAFVPLDAAWPAERLRTTLDVLQPAAVLCHTPADLPVEYRNVALSIESGRIPPTPQRPGVSLGPDDLIYGFFTSGTTGIPKCAMNLHGGVANRFRFMSRYFAATGEEVVLQNSKHTFDSSIWQLFWPLTEGGRTVLPVQGEFLDLERTVATIAEYRVTASDFVSSIFNALVALVDADPAAVLPKLASLRWLIVGSEPVNPKAVRHLTSLLPGLRVTNGYGPTETSIGMAFHPMSAEDGDAIPIGRPIDNCHAAIVDDAVRLVPAGATGEIAVGGACVGAGYLGAPRATARVFVPNPFAPHIPGDRLYLTGDLGRLDEQGRLYFLGRKDFQVKIGGMRIELGEVEAVAERCPGVRQAVVLVEEQPAGKSLALFVACDEDLSEQTLRDHLREHLPRTSLPRRVFLLPTMPLSENGKADRTELGHILDRRRAADAAELLGGAAPAGLAGRVLWAMRAALGRPDLAGDEHFMDAGGDSLKALTAVNAIRAEFDLRELCAQDLFDQPTAERLTRLIEAYQADDRTVADEPELMAADAAAPAGAFASVASVGTEGFAGFAAGTEVQTVLVAGGTGFVGSRVVHELLRTGLRVISLARAGDDARATDRVVAALSSRGLWAPEFAGRLTGVAGDLSLLGLGLADDVWERLSHSADVVLNCGAMVNFLFDYRAHRRTNVLGSGEMLRLAAGGRPVPLVQVSTLAALQDATIGRAAALPESVDVATIGAPPGGYNRSKWVAERYLAAARENGATVTVLRLGEVMPSADNGIPNPVALTHLLATAMIRLGVRPDADIRTDFSTVDYVAARIVAAVRDRTVWGDTLHVLHPSSVSFAALLDTADSPPERVSCREFLQCLRGEAERTGERALAALAALLPSDPASMDEAGLRYEFDTLLTDNATLYRADRCRAAEARWGLAESSVQDAISAYHGYLSRSVPGPLAVPAS